MTDKAIDLLAPITQPVVREFGLDRVSRLPGRTIIGLVGLAAVAFVVRMFARTPPGQALLRWIEHGVAVALPQFSIFRTVAHSLDADSEVMPVVLVAIDAGWQIGVLLAQPDQGWYPVFLPGSPRIASGSISYARAEYVPTSTSRREELWSIMLQPGRLFGQSLRQSSPTGLQAAGQLERPP